MKEITGKVNISKQIESLKQVNQIQKEQLAKQYDKMIENEKPKEIEFKPKDEDKPKVEEVRPKEEVKPKEVEVEPIKKKKIIKKCIPRSVIK